MITKDYIRTLTHTTTYKKGIELYLDNAVQNFDVDGDEFYDDIYAKVKGSGRKSYWVNMAIDVEEDCLEDCECECLAFDNYDGLCKHCVAVLLEYISYCEQQNIISEYNSKQQESLKKLQTIQKGMVRHTTPQIKELLRQKGIQRSLPYTQQDNWGRVRLEPYIQLQDTGILLEFKIGNSQMYVVKDVFSLVKRIQNHENYRYGKKLEFIHAEEMFTIQSKRYIDFLKRWTSENEERYAQSVNAYFYGYGYYREPKTREIDLDPVALDEFLEAVGEEGFLCGSWKKKPEYYYLTEERPNRSLTIIGKNDGIELQMKAVIGYRSRDYYVYFEDGKVYRIPKKDYQPIEDFLECMTEIPERKVYIEQDDIPAFCSALLPELKKIFQCEMLDFNEEDYAPVQAQCKVYLDKTDSEIITLKAVACYEGRE